MQSEHGSFREFRKMYVLRDGSVRHDSTSEEEEEEIIDPVTVSYDFNPVSKLKRQQIKSKMIEVQDKARINAMIKLPSLSTYPVSYLTFGSNNADRSPENSVLIEENVSSDYNAVSKLKHHQAELKKIELQDKALLNTMTKVPSVSTYPVPCFTFGSNNADFSVENSLLIEEEDEYNLNNNVLAMQSQKPFTYRSKSRVKRYRKKVNNLTQQLKALGIKNDEESKRTVKDKNILRKVKKSKKKSVKSILDYVELMRKSKLCPLKEEHTRYQKNSQNIKKHKPNLIQPDDNTPFPKKEGRLPSHEQVENQPASLATSTVPAAPKHEDTRSNSTLANTSEREIYTCIFNKRQSKSRSKRRHRGKIEEVLKKLVNQRTVRDLDLVTKSLTDMNLVEDVSTKIKNKDIKLIKNKGI